MGIVIERCLRYYTNSVEKEIRRDIMVKKEDIDRFKKDHLRIISNFVASPKILTEITIHRVESEKFLESGGYAEIYNLIAKVSKVNETTNEL